MEKLWTGRFKKQLDGEVHDFNSSIPFDCKMYRQDIEGSLAHAAMLAKQGIIAKEDEKQIREGLLSVLSDLESGKLLFDPACEDIHSFTEGELTKRVGDAGKRLHTARSRNDQVATDTRLYLRGRTDELIKQVRLFSLALVDAAKKNKDVILPGYTHMQRAQPITFGHQLMAYCFMLLRDIDRLKDCRKRINVSPLGSCALAGTTYDIDRFDTAAALGFSHPCENSIDGVSDRDFIIELCSVLSILMMHLSRFCEEVILWSSWEFKFIELDDAYSTGSSIMPQKKNPDITELVRGKTGRVYGDLIAALTMMKGLPLAYNKDMQEDKEGVFDACDTVMLCLSVMEPMVRTMTVNWENMRAAAAKGFINATDCADYLVKKGMPFRSAYKITGEIVAYCIDHQWTLETLPIEQYKAFSELFEEDVYSYVDLQVCASKRMSYGGTAPACVEEQIRIAEQKLL